MRKLLVLGVALLIVSSAYAELENIQVGGRIWIRGRYWDSTYGGSFGGPWNTRIPGAFLPGRPIGPFGAASRFEFDNSGDDLKYVEQNTQLSVKADFTQDVSAYIELESFDRWGSDFRSDYVTGADGITTTADDLEVMESYIEAREIYDMPLRLRIGRQQMKLGKGWLYGDLIAATVSISYDAIRLTYDTDAFEVDAWWAKLAENSPFEEDGDVDFYGIYGTYKALEPVDISLYWTWVRDGRSVNDTNYFWFAEWVEDWLDLDDYDVTNLHTFGLRAWGASGPFDYDLELAYQTGEAGIVGSGFVPFTYGDDGADFDAWAGDIEVGYTFDMAWQPRVFLGGAYFEGEDNRDLSFWDWVNPFDRPQASVSFNRMFSQRVYSWHLDILQEMSNFYELRGGIQVQPTETIWAQLRVSYLGAVDEFDWPTYFNLGRFRVPIAPNLSFWTTQSDDELGWVTYFQIKYQYSEDVFVRFTWEHLFTGEGLDDGNFIGRNGLDFIGGRDDDDCDYFMIETGITF